MKTLIFGDTQKIDWPALGVRMPFAPMHELGTKYRLETSIDYLPGNEILLQDFVGSHFTDTFESDNCTLWQFYHLLDRIRYRTNNTISALDQATPGTICINLGGGAHHAGKYPNTGYAYSLINDHIWAVDYQLEHNPDYYIHIRDLDFHFAGGTTRYYNDHPQVSVLSTPYLPNGVLYQDQDLIKNRKCKVFDRKPDKILFNFGTDLCTSDAMFGKFDCFTPEELLNDFWKVYIRQALVDEIPIAITCGGSYGDAGLALYEQLITWIQSI